jgi:hypothetical protein
MFSADRVDSGQKALNRHEFSAADHACTGKLPSLAARA